VKQNVWDGCNEIESLVEAAWNNKREENVKRQMWDRREEPIIDYGSIIIN
jgi:hypothetical protein